MTNLLLQYYEALVERKVGIETSMKVNRDVLRVARLVGNEKMILDCKETIQKLEKDLHKRGVWIG